MRVQEAPSWLVYTPQSWPSCPDFPPSTPAPLAAPGWLGSAPDPALLPLAHCWAAALTWRGLQHVLSWPTNPMEAIHLGWGPYGLLWVSWQAHSCPLAPPFLTESLPVHPLARLCPQLGMASASPRPCLDHSLLCIPSSPGSLHLLTSNHPLSPAWSGCDAGTLLDNLINLEEEDQLHGPLHGPLAQCGHF